ncbi:hypothetical protein BH23CHL5_BH23CHL5_09170 [soil metagenome]
MTAGKESRGRSAKLLETAEDVAASVDQPTLETAESEARTGEHSESELKDVVEDVLESAEMVAEGGPVGPATDTPAAGSAHDAELNAMLEQNMRESDDGQETDRVDHQQDAEETVADSIESAAYGPVASPPRPGPGNPSPDGATLAFLQEDAEGETRLWLYAIDASGGWSMGLPFLPVVEPDGPQWSPDGLWIALPGRRSWGGPTSIWLAPADGGDCLLLADHQGSDRQPRWSPDGSLIAFVSRLDDRDTICAAIPDGNGPVIQLTYAHPGQDDRDPCWSEDSSRVAFVRRATDGDSAGDHVWSVSLASGELKQATKKLASRYSLRWSPGKMQIAFVTDEGEWNNIGVVNPDNSAGWNLASETGDKDDPQYSPDGSRMVYTRALRGEVRLCERATSGANPDLLDPGMGVVSSARWLPDKRVVYRFAPATGSPHFIVQEARKDSDRTILPSAIPWHAGRPLISPTYTEFETTSGAKVGGLLYRDPAVAGKSPGIIVIDDRPYRRIDAAFGPFEQALAAAGFAVLTPTLPGRPGAGKKVATSIGSGSSADAEVLDIADAIAMLRDLPSVDERNIAMVGIGYGGAMAMLLAGTRPGSVEAIVAIDPVADWDDEFNQGSVEWRSWQMGHFGLPSASRGFHSLRTPATFVGVIECPALILGTSSAAGGRSAQRIDLLETVSSLGVQIEREELGRDTTWEVAERAASFLRQHFGENLVPIDVPETPSGEVPDAERADDV